MAYFDRRAAAWRSPARVIHKSHDENTPAVNAGAPIRAAVDPHLVVLRTAPPILQSVSESIADLGVRFTRSVEVSSAKRQAVVDEQMPIGYVQHRNGD